MSLTGWDFYFRLQQLITLEPDKTWDKIVVSAWKQNYEVTSCFYRQMDKK
jgi:hypothetical protein